MSKFKEIILKNPDVDFVVHITSKQQLDELVSVLEELGFEFIVPSFGTIRQMAEAFVREDGYDGCWRVSRERGVSYYPSIEHWRLYTNNIVELRNGEIVSHEYISAEDVEIEKNKLRKTFLDEDYGEDALRSFGLENRSAKEIEQWLAEKFASFTEEYSRIYE